VLKKAYLLEDWDPTEKAFGTLFARQPETTIARQGSKNNLRRIEPGIEICPFSIR